VKKTQFQHPVWGGWFPFGYKKKKKNLLVGKVKKKPPAGGDTLEKGKRGFKMKLGSKKKRNNVVSPNWLTLWFTSKRCEGHKSNLVGG